MTAKLLNLLTVVFSLVSIDVVVLVGGGPLSGGVLHAGLVLSLRHSISRIGDQVISEI